MQSSHLPVRWLSFFMPVLVLIAVGCKHHYSLESAWRDKTITIDGSDKDWSDRGRYYDEKSNTKIAIYNDNNWLYICLESMDPGIQASILRHGLTIWLCKNGTNETVWGLRYPYMARDLAGDAEFGEFDMPGGPGAPRRGQNDWRNKQSRDASKDRMKQKGRGAPTGGPPERPSFGDDDPSDLNIPVNDVFFVLDSEKETESMLMPDEIHDLGIFCKFSQRKGSGMIYEIKIPLNRSEKTPYAARLSSEQIVSIGFITEKASGERKRNDGGMRHGPGDGGPDRGGPGGGMMFGEGPGGGGPSGGPPGGGRGGRPEMGRGGMGGPMGGRARVELIEIWANIKLSTNPGSN